MSEAASTFFIELSSLFNPKGFDEADRKTAQSANAFAAATKRAAAASNSAMDGFFNISSKNFLDLEILAKKSFGGILSSFLSTMAQMAARSALTGLFGGIGGGFFGGLLGSRRTGGPIGKTGPYLLHEGEFVLPPETVDAIKQSRAPAANGAGTIEGAVNISVNAPISIQTAAAGGADARQLADEIAQAARRGVSWAVEAAKINYKIGRNRSTEASL